MDEAFILLDGPKYHSDENRSSASNACDTSSVMEKIEGCNQDILKLVDLQETFFLENISVFSQKLTVLQNKLSEALMTAEKTEARRQASEFKLVYSSMTNEKLYEICSKQYELLEDNRYSVEMTKNRFRELLQRIVTHWNDLNVEWHVARTSLEQQVQKLTTGNQQLVVRLESAQEEATVMKQVNDGLQEQITSLTNLINEQNIEVASLKDRERSMEKELSELLDDNRRLQEQVLTLEKQLGEIHRQKAGSVFQVESFKRMSERYADLLQQKYLRLCNDLDALDGRLSKQVETIATRQSSIQWSILTEKPLCRVDGKESERFNCGDRCQSTCCDSHKSHDQCRTRSFDHHHADDEDNVNNLEGTMGAKLCKALHEVSRWRRRYKKQQLLVYMQRQRFNDLRETHQADQKLKKQFLDSVCKLIQEASRQIDRVVYKHIRRLVSSVQKPSTPVNGAIPCNPIGSSDVSEHPTPRTRRSIAARTPSQQYDNTGDGRALSSPQQMRSEDELQNVCLHTNCNNNVGLSPSTIKSPMNGPSYCANVVQSVASSGTYMWSESTAPDKAPLPSPSPQDRQVGHDSFEDLDDCQSVLDSVATTSDPFDSDNAPELPKGDELINLTLITDTGQVSGDHSHADLNQTEIARQWLEFRAAVRLELGRVIGSVVNHAKQDDSMAKECLDAIIDLQKRMLTDVPATLADERGSPRTATDSRFDEATSQHHPLIPICMDGTDKPPITNGTPTLHQASKSTLSTTLKVPELSPHNGQAVSDPEGLNLPKSPNSCMGEITSEHPDNLNRQRVKNKKGKREPWKLAGKITYPLTGTDPNASQFRCGCKPRRENSEPVKTERPFDTSNRRRVNSSDLKQSSSDSQKLNENMLMSKAGGNAIKPVPKILPPITSSTGSTGSITSKYVRTRMKWPLGDTSKMKSPIALSCDAAGKSRTGRIGSSDKEIRVARISSTASSMPLDGSSNNTSTGQRTPFSVSQWVELEEQEMICSESVRPGRLSQRNRCCCGTSCCLGRNFGQ